MSVAKTGDEVKICLQRHMATIISKESLYSCMHFCTKYKILYSFHLIKYHWCFICLFIPLYVQKCVSSEGDKDKPPWHFCMSSWWGKRVNTLACYKFSECSVQGRCVFGEDDVDNLPFSHRQLGLTTPLLKVQNGQFQLIFFTVQH